MSLFLINYPTIIDAGKSPPPSTTATRTTFATGTSSWKTSCSTRREERRWGEIEIVTFLIRFHKLHNIFFCPLPKMLETQKFSIQRKMRRFLPERGEIKQAPHAVNYMHAVDIGWVWHLRSSVNVSNCLYILSNWFILRIKGVSSVTLFDISCSAFRFPLFLFSLSPHS